MLLDFHLSLLASGITETIPLSITTRELPCVAVCCLKEIREIGVIQESSTSRSYRVLCLDTSEMFARHDGGCSHAHPEFCVISEKVCRDTAEPMPTLKLPKPN